MNDAQTAFAAKHEHELRKLVITDTGLELAIEPDSQ